MRSWTSLTNQCPCTGWGALWGNLWGASWWGPDNPKLHLSWQGVCGDIWRRPGGLIVCSAQLPSHFRGVTWAWLVGRNAWGTRGCRSLAVPWLLVPWVAQDPLQLLGSTTLFLIAGSLSMATPSYTFPCPSSCSTWSSLLSAVHNFLIALCPRGAPLFIVECVYVDIQHIIFTAPIVSRIWLIRGLTTVFATSHSETRSQGLTALLKATYGVSVLEPRETGKWSYFLCEPNSKGTESRSRSRPMWQPLSCFAHAHVIPFLVKDRKGSYSNISSNTF